MDIQVVVGQKLLEIPTFPWVFTGEYNLNISEVTWRRLTEKPDFLWLVSGESLCYLDSPGHGDDWNAAMSKKGSQSWVVFGKHDFSSSNLAIDHI